MDEKKLNIIEIATALFLDKGFHSTSVQDIAVACNISKATIYKYFSSKEDISLAVLLRINENIIKNVKDIALQEQLNDREKLKASILSLINNFLPETKFIDALIFTFSPEQKEQYLPIISKNRFRVFCAYAQSIGLAFNLQNEAAAWELTINLTGQLKEIALLEPHSDLQLDKNLLADLVIDSLDATAKQRQGKPLLVTNDYLQKLKAYYDTNKPDFRPICQRLKLFEALRNQVTLESPHDLRKDLFDAITLLEQEHQKPIPKYLLIEALYAYLSQRQELAETVTRLKDLPRKK